MSHGVAGIDALTPTKVLYIAGRGRSGSTVLDNILGEIDGFFSAGEIRHVWRRGLLEQRLCGCGQPVVSCPVWCEILKLGYGAIPSAEVAKHIVELDEQVCRTRDLLPVHNSDHVSERAAYAAALGPLYGAIARHSGASVIVDSSKTPLYASILRQIPSLDVYVLHLVRDPRAVAYSWMRRKIQVDDGDPRPMHRLGLLRASLLWDVWNLAVERLQAGRSDRYLRLSYEAFAESPRRSVSRILDFVGASTESLPFIDEHAVSLSPNHTVSGNPSRFVSGTVEIRADREWAKRMPRASRLVVTALTSPLLRRYGYPVRLGGL
jgi:hypothetical protein